MNEEQKLQHTQRIRELNDRMRSGLDGGIIVFAGELANGSIADMELLRKRHAILAKVRTAEIDPDNNPHHENDFGKVEHDGEEFFWKIDYFSNGMDEGSENPADPDVTTRLMTIFHVGDY